MITKKDTPLLWNDLCLLSQHHRPSTFLKITSELWGIHVKSIVEIGVFRGNTSRELRLLFPDAHLYLVDPWEIYEEYLSKEAGPIATEPQDYEKAFQTVQTTFGQDPRATILRQTSMQALGSVPDGVDLVFIDGNHDYPHVKEDIKHWYSKVRPGGILSGHDYTKAFPGVVRAVDEFFPKGVVLGSDTTWLVTRQ